MGKPQPLAERIARRVRSSREGSVFVTGSFLDLGTRAGVDQALARLARQGTIRRLARGIYDRPRTNARLGIALAPAPDEVARAIAGSEASRLQVAGAQAANVLGLSTQIPARIVYLTDATPRTIRIGEQALVFRHASPRQMATAGCVSGTVIQALRYIGKRNATEEVVERLRRTLSVRDKTILMKDRLYAPGWIQPILERIAATSAETQP